MEDLIERVGMALVWLILLLHPLSFCQANEEGDVLWFFKQGLTDPDNILQSWDVTLTNPCTWFHVTCNNDNYVIRIDLGGSGLSGTLIPKLGKLKSLQYLELYNNKINGSIPNELGDLTSLVSLDLFYNNLTGTIPNTLAKLSLMRFLRLNGNNLTGQIPLELTNTRSLKVLDLSDNDLWGDVPTNGSFVEFTPASFYGNPRLHYPKS